ncbi:unnamed protein product [Lepidochelys olivacea]
MLQTGGVYAMKERKKPVLKSPKPPPPEGVQSNPSKRHRDHLNQELSKLTSLLPFPKDVQARLDTLSILWLIVGYLKVKNYFMDEQDEEKDDELGESTQYTVLSNSQDLFITLTEIPSQPKQAGEGTSGNCKCFKPPSSVPKAISDKAAKKHRRDEMFSKLMQSSGIDRAVWRVTIAAYRTVDEEREERWRQEDQRRHESMRGLLRDQTVMLRRLVEVHERQQDHTCRCSPCLTALLPPQVP